MIRTIQDVAQHLQADASDDGYQCLRSIKRRVYKDTDCGVSCDFGLDSLEIDDTLIRRTPWARGVVLTIRLTEKIIGPRFVVSGYCEGFDGDLPSYTVAMPCTGQDLDHAIESADLDGCQMFDEINQSVA